MQKELIKYFSELVTPERFALFQQILQNRTKYLTVVLEDIYQSQNASAVLRSCDCFGIQDVHIIENQNIFDVDTQVALGSSKWVTLHKYSEKENNTLEAIQSLRNNGYRIVATSPHEKDIDLEEFDLAKGKSALFFGSELPGISDIIKNEADEFLKIPMVGFTESFNISVSVAIILHHLTYKLRNSENIPWQLSEKDLDETILNWLRNTINRSDLIEKDFYKTRK